MTAAEPTASRSWTVRLRTRLRAHRAAGQVLPDRQPAYVALLDLRLRRAHPGRPRGRARVRRACSRSAAPPGGTPPRLGHFVNSLHLWSVELFFAFMVIHLWGKFFMAAWRGRRALTWITGAVAFVGSIGTAFTGYLSQTNFDSQWISHAGQGRPERGRHRRLLQRAEPRPDAAVARRAAAAGRRRRSSSGTWCWSAATASCRRSTPSPPDEPDRRPEPDRQTTAVDPPSDHRTIAQPVTAAEARRDRRRRRPTPDSHLFPTRPYDLVKEFVIALVVVGAARPWRWRPSSPRPTSKAITLADWATRRPTTSSRPRPASWPARRTSAGYGPPYNHASHGQKLGPLPLQKWGGVRIPVDSAQRPGHRAAAPVAGDPALTRRPGHAGTAPRADQQTAWASALRRRAGRGARTATRPGRGRRLRAGAACWPRAS